MSSLRLAEAPCESSLKSLAGYESAQQSSCLFQTSRESNPKSVQVESQVTEDGSPSPKEILNLVKISPASNLKSCQGKSIMGNERFESC